MEISCYWLPSLETSPDGACYKDDLNESSHDNAMTYTAEVYGLLFQTTGKDFARSSEIASSSDRRQPINPDAL